MARRLGYKAEATKCFVSNIKTWAPQCLSRKYQRDMDMTARECLRMNFEGDLDACLE